MNYEAKARAVREKLKSAGYQVTLRRPGSETFDPVTGETVPGIPVDYTAYVLEQSYRIDQIDGTLVKRGDRKFMLTLEDMSKTPQPASDTLVVSGKVLSIIAADPFQPGGVPIYYTVQARA